MATLRSADLEAIVLCPSNPFVSIDPILSLPGMRRLIADAGVPVIAVSPIIGGAAVKGPAAKMMRELDFDPSAATVAAHYRGLIIGFVMDTADTALAPAGRCPGMTVKLAETLMRNRADQASAGAGVPSHSRVRCAGSRRLDRAPTAHHIACITIRALWRGRRSCRPTSRCRITVPRAAARFGPVDIAGSTLLAKLPMRWFRLRRRGRGI